MLASPRDFRSRRTWSPAASIRSNLLACIAVLGAPIDQDDCTWTISGEPRLSGVGDDREQPFAWVLPGRTVERLQRGHVSVLHDVFGVRDAARQQAHQRIGVVQMQQHQFREAPLSGFGWPHVTIGLSGRSRDLALHLRMQAAKIDNLAGHVESQSEAFVRVEGSEWKLIVSATSRLSHNL
jgi:hypothetical protein